MPFTNPYADGQRALAYARLGIENTYYLAYRDLPDLFETYHISGAALDFGCGTGRSTRFLRNLGFSVIGVDISDAMVAAACEQDPGGDYRTIDPGDLRAFPNSTFDLVLSEFPFDSIATMQAKVDTLREISRVLSAGGHKILVASTRELYLREWVSFSSAPFPDNRLAKSGSAVKVIVKDIGDDRAVEDVLWTEDAYEKTFAETPLRLLEKRHPVATSDDGCRCAWISERNYAPFVVFVLKKTN